MNNQDHKPDEYQHLDKPHRTLQYFLKYISQDPKVHKHALLWAILSFVIIFLIWASLAPLDEVTNAEGKVIPSQKIQVIQNLEGGIVKSLYVKEGQIVAKNQPLLQIDDTETLGSYREDQAKAFYLQAKIARLTAEMNDQPFNPTLDLIKQIPDQIKSEQAQYNAGQNELASMQQKRSLLEKQLAMSEPLEKSGSISPVEILQIQQSISDLDVQINTFQNSLLNDLNEASGDLATIQANLITPQDRLARTTVRSPVRGIIKNMDINTVGGVIKPGEDILEIVPLDDTLLVEAQVRPRDIGFLHPNQPAMVKITAYDYSIYGGLPGKLEEISADSTTDDKNQSFYKIQVRTFRNYLGTAQHPLQIIPGMTATVDVLTGKRTVLEYILNPILKAKQQALRER